MFVLIDSLFREHSFVVVYLRLFGRLFVWKEVYRRWHQRWKRDATPKTKKGVRTISRRRVTAAEKTPSGRELHEEKITVYLSTDELFDLDQARLMLRGDLGLAVDRGRIVRESIAVIIADLDAKGDQSILARRLRGI